VSDPMAFHRIALQSLDFPPVSRCTAGCVSRIAARRAVAAAAPAHLCPSRPAARLYLDSSRRARPLPRGFTGHVAPPVAPFSLLLLSLYMSRVPRRSILSFYFSLSEIRLLSRPGFAAVIRPLFNQFLGRHRVKGNNCPIGFSVYDWTVPDVRRD
jgi:hypothetical protein